MKCVVILPLLYAVSLAQDPLNSTNTSNRYNDGDNDRWIWGYVDDANVTDSNKTENRNDDEKGTTTSTLAPLPPYRPSPCPWYDPPPPSFKAPGRKISDEKCEEYKWKKMVEAEAHRRYKECWAEINKGKPPPPAAVGGRPTFLGEFPHMGAIGWKAAIGDGYIFKCGSTLISEKWVLTAAHCSKASSLDTTLADVVPKIIRLNDKNIFETDDNGVYVSQDFNISRVIVHPDFKPPKKYFDIALIELQKTVEFTWRMYPGCLWTNADVSSLGREATLTGWGVLASGSIDISPELQAAVVNIINTSFCDDLLHTSHNRNWWGLQEHQLCAGKLEGGVDACQGDSGGPLQVKELIKSANKSVYHIIGVTSFGIGCALPNHPGIYTRVSSFIDWLEGYVWPQ